MDDSISNIPALLRVPGCLACCWWEWAWLLRHFGFTELLMWKNTGGFPSSRLSSASLEVQEQLTVCTGQCISPFLSCIILFIHWCQSACVCRVWNFSITGESGGFRPAVTQISDIALYCFWWMYIYWFHGLNSFMKLHGIHVKMCFFRLQHFMVFPCLYSQSPCVTWQP